MREEKIELIEDLLSKALPLLSESDYQHLINGNDNLSKYDMIAGKVDNNEYPINYLDKISDTELDNILLYLKEATKRWLLLYLLKTNQLFGWLV